MADLKISELSTETPLTGTELVEVVTGGVNKKTTTQDIANLGGGAHWRGSWAGTTAFPVDADNVGSDADGDILSGDTFVFTNQVVFGGSVFMAKSVAIAIQNSPTTLAHWTILAPQS